jgi:hypothetical protein
VAWSRSNVTSARRSSNDEDDGSASCAWALSRVARRSRSSALCAGGGCPGPMIEIGYGVEVSDIMPPRSSGSSPTSYPFHDCGWRASSSRRKSSRVHAGPSEIAAGSTAAILARHGWSAAVRAARLRLIRSRSLRALLGRELDDRQARGGLHFPSSVAISDSPAR